MFIVLADQVPPDLVTVASRCVRIRFSALSEATIHEVLVAEGASPERAMLAAKSAEGNLSRARVLVSDDGLMARRDTFAHIPHRLDGTGSTAHRLCNELLGLIEDAAAPLAARQAEEVVLLEQKVAATGERGSGRKQLEERHKRELRRHRTDELRSGLAVVAGTYRDALVAGDIQRPDSVVAAVTRLHKAIDDFTRNPNELLLLQAWLLDLPTLPGGGR